MKRDIIQLLVEWKNRKNRKPLILRGARQVGKTYIIDQFAQDHFFNYAKINLEKNPEYRKLFNTNDVNKIIRESSILLDKDIIPGKTLFFIDEIQTCPEAILALRYFKEEFPELHVICAGSLLDHTLNEMKTPMPVGRVEFLYMYPMTYKEFLCAIKQEKLVSYIESYNFSETFSELIHKKISEYLRYYYFIGGMPEAVKIFSENDKLTETERIHGSILTSFQYDFAKYGTRKQQEYLITLLRYCGRYPCKKIKYSNIDRDTRSIFLKESMKNLSLSNIINIVRHTNSKAVPLSDFKKDEVYKTIFLDIGLVNHLSHIELNKIENLITSNEGALAEQFIGQELIAYTPSYIKPELFYWIREEKNSNAEVDYLFQCNNTIYPIEVKAGKTGTLKSLHIYLFEKQLKTGIRFNMDLPSYGKFTSRIIVKNKNTKINYNLLSLPLYMVSELNRLEKYLK